MELSTNLWTILLASGLTAVVTGLGALPFLFFNNFNRWWLSIFQSAAAGLMLGACFNLIQEGANLDPYRTFFGILLGLVMIVLADHLISRRGSNLDVGDLVGADARKALLVLGIMTAHSFAEGIGSWRILGLNWVWFGACGRRLNHVVLFGDKLS